MKNTKTVILTAVLTTLATNVLLSSWLFWIVLFLGAWFYLGYLGQIIDGEDGVTPVIAFGPLTFFVALCVCKLDGLDNLWYHFFSKPLPQIRSPFVFDSGDKRE